MSWKKGPLPAGTWQWGGVMLVGQPVNCFHFADFHGDHVLLAYEDGKRVEAGEVAYYNNDLSLPLPKEVCSDVCSTPYSRVGQVVAGLLLLACLLFTGCNPAAYLPAPKGSTFDYTIEPSESSPVTVEAPAAHAPDCVSCTCDKERNQSAHEQLAAMYVLLRERVDKLDGGGKDPLLESKKPADNAGPPKLPAAPHKPVGEWTPSGGDCANGNCPTGRSGLPVFRRFGRRG